MTTPIDTKINYCLNITARNDENSEELGVDCLLSAISKSYSQKEAAEFMAKVVMSRTDINSTSLFKSLCSEAEQRGDRDMAKDIHSAAIEMFSSKIRDDHTAQVDITELKFCLSAKLGELTKYLTAKAPLEQARLLVVLQEFRPKLAFQLPFHIDLAEASNITGALNGRLFISRVARDRELTGRERAVAKYFILRLLNTEAGTNLKGKHYNGWINITGVPRDKDGNIINMTVDIDQSSRAPREVIELISK